jgi:hypothetical protein
MSRTLQDISKLLQQTLAHASFKWKLIWQKQIHSLWIIKSLNPRVAKIGTWSNNYASTDGQVKTSYWKVFKRHKHSNELGCLLHFVDSKSGWLLLYLGCRFENNWMKKKMIFSMIMTMSKSIRRRRRRIKTMELISNQSTPSQSSFNPSISI